MKGHLNRLGVGVGGEGDEIYFPEVAVKKKVRFQGRSLVVAFAVRFS